MEGDGGRRNVGLHPVHRLRDRVQPLGQRRDLQLKDSGKSALQIKFKPVLPVLLAAVQYTVFHSLVVEVSCVLFLTQPACIVQKQNTRNLYHKPMRDGVEQEGSPERVTNGSESLVL